jgi:hypothetical protein
MKFSLRLQSERVLLPPKIIMPCLYTRAQPTNQKKPPKSPQRIQVITETFPTFTKKNSKLKGLLS